MSIQYFLSILLFGITVTNVSFATVKTGMKPKRARTLHANLWVSPYDLGRN